MIYRAPIAEQLFVLETVAELSSFARFPRFAALDHYGAQAILEEGARLTESIFAPLNQLGDVEGATWSPQGVRHPAGFDEAYAEYVAGGWGGLAADPQFGGQGLPFIIATAFGEQLAAANMAFSLCMLLNSGAVEAISAHGSALQKALYLPKMISGEWSGTMNLTEPQAGSDVGALRTMATPSNDGSWRVKGSKIFITWGEHELAKNIVHLVLARTPGSPPGTKGISLFLVPKYVPDADGNPGTRNDLRCLSLEHKLGIHASPTCAMSFGDDGKCVGWLIGREHAGMRAMFTMMNAARVNVGLEGVAIAERAYQGALAYARERIQSAAIGGKTPVRIIEHPDVRRMLMTMRAGTQAIRAIAYFNAAAIDRSRVEDDINLRRAAMGRAELLTPITKSYATEMGTEIANLGIQVFGGLGYIETTGAAQHLRDVRISQIYEGTNGIQALDLVGRKLHVDHGVHWRRLLEELRITTQSFRGEELGSIAKAILNHIELLTRSVEHVAATDPRQAAGAASSLLKMFGITLGAALLGKQAASASESLASNRGNKPFLLAKIATARFFVDEILPQAGALCTTIANASYDRLDALSEDQFMQ